MTCLIDKNFLPGGIGTWPLKANLDYKRLNYVPYLSFPLDIEVSTPLRALQYPINDKQLF